jgi:hypothetical protein
VGIGGVAVAVHAGGGIAVALRERGAVDAVLVLVVLKLVAGATLLGQGKLGERSLYLVGFAAMACGAVVEAVDGVLQSVRVHKEGDRGTVGARLDHEVFE